ncbi:hypothetical protein [Pontibacter fetidus]|uniref:Uncharacterized protein n=1 Tax=Pontibacter fetidus TaxID=2700082 RepID=A0A6B2H5R2_9BACT|nr:hypothetical protein [Pontibacter fetidus]NDK55637.1 hypothetical protein [Pontibacter fetidus]
MKSYLLLFFSTIFLLFGIQKSSSLPGVADFKQNLVTQSCKYSKHGLKKPCSKKCLKHTSHSEQKGAATTVSDCTQQAYAIVTAQQQHTFYTSAIVRSTIVTGINKHLSPFLETEHAPPRLS